MDRFLLSVSFCDARGSGCRWKVVLKSPGLGFLGVQGSQEFSALGSVSGGCFLWSEPAKDSH